MQFDYVVRSSVYVSEEEISELRQLMAEGMDFDHALEEAIEDDDRLYLVTEYVYDALKAEVLLGQVDEKSTFLALIYKLFTIL